MNRSSTPALRFLAAAALTLAAGAATAETLTVGGTGAALGTLRLLAAEFTKAAPMHSVRVVPNLGGGGSMKALAAGAIDLAAVARPLMADEAAQGLVAAEYGKTALVVATNTKDAGTVGSLAELAEIYAGRRTAWSEGRPIRLVLRPKADADTMLQEAYSPELKQVMQQALTRQGILIAATDQDAVEYIERTPGAIGVTSLAVVRGEQRNVNVLPLGGVAPSPRSVADGSYPYPKQMMLVRKGAATPAVARFFEFIASAKGRQILADAGHWVADAPAHR